MKKILKISLVLRVAAFIINPFSTNAGICEWQGIKNGYCLLITERDEEGNPIRSYLNCVETLPEGEESRPIDCHREIIIT